MDNILKDIDLIEILLSIVVLLFGIFGMQFRKYLQKVFGELSQTNNHESFRTSTLCGSWIQDRISDLRHKLNSDRCSVLQFHNGSYFNTRQPIWKLSSTNESCKLGIDYESADMQDFPCTSILHVLTPFFGEKVSGVVRLDIDEDSRKGVYHYVIDDLPDSMTKTWLSSRSIREMIVTPLVAPSDGRVIGFISVDYLMSSASIVNYMELKKCASQIAYNLERIMTKDGKKC